MVLKGADKSSNTNKLPFPFPIVEAISLKTLKSASFISRLKTIIIQLTVITNSTYSNEATLGLTDTCRVTLLCC